MRGQRQPTKKRQDHSCTTALGRPGYHRSHAIPAGRGWAGL